MRRGRCECGQVSFTVETVRDSITHCHCRQCRRMSGHVWASTHAPFEAVTFERDDGLAWYASSDFAKRGFCRECGASLFYRMNDEDGIGIAAGCLDDTTGLHTGKHIFVADKGAYYDICDGKPSYEQGS